jgi:hypothetical protein
MRTSSSSCFPWPLLFRPHPSVAGGRRRRQDGRRHHQDQDGADGKSAVATLKDNKSGNSVTINITDDLTLDKFKDKRIVEGDEIRAKYDNAGGKNESKSFKKTAGC